MRKIDIFNHFFPQAYFHKMLELAPMQKDMGKRVRNIPMLHDLEAPNLMLARIHFENGFHYIIDMALRVDAARDGEAQQFMPRRFAEHHRANLYRPYARMPV